MWFSWISTHSSLCTNEFGHWYWVFSLPNKHCVLFYKLHNQYGKKSMCWLNIFISGIRHLGQDNRRIQTHIFLKSDHPLKFCQIYFIQAFMFTQNIADLRSHWIRSRLNCCSAPMETCLTLLSIRKFNREVATCLHADMQEVLATFSCNTIRFTFELNIQVLVSFTKCCQTLFKVELYVYILDSWPIWHMKMKI